jgi:hypothetical protein
MQDQYNCCEATAAAYCPQHSQEEAGRDMQIRTEHRNTSSNSNNIRPFSVKWAEYCNIFRAAVEIRAALNSRSRYPADLKRAAEDSFRRHGVLPPEPEARRARPREDADGLGAEDCLILAQAELMTAAAQLDRGMASARDQRSLDGLATARRHTAAALEALNRLPSPARG